MTVYFAQQRALHVAILPDGNDAWAAAKGLSRTAGHRAGVEAVRRTLDVAPGLGIGTLTLHALACDGWRLPAAEMRSILDCIGELLASETATCLRNGVRVSVIGRRSRLSGDLLAIIERSEETTACGRGSRG
jgi:undecaprenyl diphosphate synthase